MALLLMEVLWVERSEALELDIEEVLGLGLVLSELGVALLGETV